MKRVLRVKAKHCNGDINFNIKINAPHLTTSEIDTVKRDLANQISHGLMRLRYIGFDVTEV
jgi:hypothetical protein